MKDTIDGKIVASLPLGYAYHRIILDAEGNPADYMFLEVNGVFEELTGLKRDLVCNRRFSDLRPTMTTEDQERIALYGRVALHGRPERFEYFSAPRQRWYQVHVHSPEKQHAIAYYFDIDEARSYRAAMAHRLDYERSFAAASIALNRNDHRAIDRALGHILECSEASRIYIFENFTDQQGRLAMRQIFEVCADGVSPQIDNPELQHVVYDEQGFGRWQRALSRNEVIHGTVTDFPASEQAILRAQDIRSLLVIPIFVNDHWYGFIGFDDVVCEREWSEEDVLLLRTFSRMLTTWFQRMDSQKDLVSRKEQFELAVRGSNDGIWDWDLQSNALFLSTRWKGMLGYSDDELKNEFATFQSLLHDEDTLGVMEYVRRYLEGEIGTYDTEFRLRHKDGTYRWIRARGEALRGPDGKPYRMAGSHTDITQEKNSALRLAEREEQFRIIFHSSPQPMALTEAHTGKLIEVNDVFCEKLQAPRSKILGRTTTELGFYTPADREVFTSRLLAEGSVKGLEMDFTTPEGKTITAKMFATFVTVNSRKYVLTIFDDITEQKRAETELIAAKQAAEAASRAKSEFLSNMSHEIRTPLNGVIGFSSLLQQTALQPVQMQYVENITSSAHLLLGIINDILDFSKIEAGKLELELVKTDLIALLQQSVDIIKFPAERKGLEVLLDIEPHLPRFARVDPIRLKQVLANLLGNAIKFTAKGEVALKVRCSRSDSGQATLYFTIRDTGIGIPRHRQKRLFKAFSQADSSTTRQFGGTGLGLIISDMLTKKMGGTIELSSRPGKGTVFSFCIETVVECGNGRASSHIEEVKRCLVVDDNEHSRQILEHMLGAWGIECTGCDNGLESLKILEHNEPFDALIVDYHMPYLDGLETIRMIRRKLHLSPAEQPVILLHSSTEDAAFIEACEELGIRFRLTKPVKSQELFNYLHGLGADTEETKSAGNDARAMWQGNGAGLDKRRATILIAEDNATNLLLAQAMIRQILPSARLVEARDGREAIERIRQSRPDIIIMDVQMPVMDGNEATIAIRQAERTTGRHVPIIGLTAGATKSERKKSLRCGMDEYLTKPIETDGLRALVHKYLTSPSHRPEQNGDTDTDANHFDRVTLAKVLNDEELFRRLCHDARADISAKLTALRTALSDEALEEMERIAHSLKGVSLNMRFGRLASHAQTIREHIRGGQRRDVEITMAEMEEEWDTVLSLLDGDT